MKAIYEAADGSHYEARSEVEAHVLHCIDAGYDIMYDGYKDVATYPDDEAKRLCEPGLKDVKKVEYIIHSGEGDYGTIETFFGDEKALQKQLKKERCGGDRWARGYKYAHENQDGQCVFCEVERDRDYRSFSASDIDD